MANVIEESFCYPVRRRDQTPIICATTGEERERSGREGPEQERTLATKSPAATIRNEEPEVQLVFRSGIHVEIAIHDSLPSNFGHDVVMR